MTRGEAYIVAFNAGRCKLQANVTDFWIEHIVAMIVKTRMKFYRCVVGPCVRCDVDEIRYFRFGSRAHFEIADIHVRRNLNTVFDRILFGILVAVANVK